MKPSDPYANAAHPVIRQRWVLMVPTGETYDAGYSYHLTSQDHVDYVSAVMSAAERQGDQGREEPLGAPELYQVSNLQLSRYTVVPHGFRSR